MRKIFPTLTLLLLFAASVTFAQDARTAPPDATQFVLQPIVTGYPRALYVTHADDGSGRLFLVQQSGQVHIINADGTVLPQPFLDVSGQISGDALGNGYTERGLLGLAFSPTFTEDGIFFINYTENGSHDTIIARYTVSDDPNLADTSSAAEIFRTAQPFGNHNGGHLAFGPDGYLYVSLGDGGSAGDPLNNGQNTQTLLGSILRINVMAPASSGYSIPPTNPFADGSAGMPEIWAYGLRNVWRFSFDRLTGDMWIGDVGQNQFEEINYQSASSAGGENYGWNVFEATRPYSGAAVPAGLTMPIAEYQHVAGHCSVTGGYVYRGSTVTTLQGAYVFGDFCSGQLWTTYRTTDEMWETNPLIDTALTISSFGEDEAGELYVVHYGTNTLSGQVLKIVPVQ